MVFIALRKRLFGERLSTLFARLLGFSSSSLMLVTLSISWLAWLLTADSRIRKVARPPIQPVAMLLPRNGEAINGGERTVPAGNIRGSSARAALRPAAGRKFSSKARCHCRSEVTG